MLDNAAFLQNFTASNETVPQDSIDAGCILKTKLSFRRRMQFKKKSKELSKTDKIRKMEQSKEYAKNCQQM